MYQVKIEMKNILVKLCIIFAVLAVMPASASIGKIIYGFGSNYAYDADGNRRDLKKGSKINEGDTLVTGRGRMHVRLIDGGFISVYPDSEYKIEKFKFSGRVASTTKEKTGNKNKTVKAVSESKEDRGFFSLLKGAARQVTGLLGRTYNENFKLKTPVATIGIRGTGFFARLCQADCFDADGNPMQDGMYVKNNIGVITMTTNVGDVALAQGQSAFAASSEDVPQQVIQPPIAYYIATPDLELFDFDEKVTDTRNGAGLLAADLPTNPQVDPPVAPPAVAVRHMAYISSTSLFTSEPLYGLDTLDTDVNSDIVQVGDAIEGFNTEVLVDTVLDPVIFDSGTATLAESGKNETYGVLWNRWSGGYSLTQAGNPVTSLDGNLHMIGSADLTAVLPVTGRISYSGTGGTSPTFTGEQGVQVGTQAVTAEIDYGTMEMVTLNITATFADASVNAGLSSPSGNTILGSDMNTYAVSGGCTGAGCGGNGGFLAGEASVNIVGNNAEAIYGTYNLTSSGNNNAVSGSYLAIDVTKQ
ncbi:hypothetical protein MNBD_GAMMA06-1135 [hydrothermal vent metagenome]|uniref:Uncharacterized protein n=1 Tax=hydrothermal vent metagenome TaxID=652676 RepID=A0A3B0WK14_9ZZZZ